MYFYVPLCVIFYIGRGQSRGGQKTTEVTHLACHMPYIWETLFFFKEGHFLSCKLALAHRIFVLINYAYGRW